MLIQCSSVSSYLLPSQYQNPVNTLEEFIPLKESILINPRTGIKLLCQYFVTVTRKLGVDVQIARRKTELFGQMQVVTLKLEDIVGGIDLRLHSDQFRADQHVAATGARIESVDSQHIFRSGHDLVSQDATNWGAGIGASFPADMRSANDIRLGRSASCC